MLRQSGVMMRSLRLFQLCYNSVGDEVELLRSRSFLGAAMHGINSGSSAIMRRWEALRFEGVQLGKEVSAHGVRITLSDTEDLGELSAECSELRVHLGVSLQGELLQHLSDGRGRWRGRFSG